MGGGQVSRNGGVAILYFIILYFIFLWRFLMMQHKKNLDMFISPLLTNMCYKTTAQMKYKMTGIVIVLIVLIAVLIIHANNKHSA